MGGARFDILFAGKLLGDADPDLVRRQLQQRFKLSDEVADKLFSGRTVVVAQGVETAAASRYRQVFRDAKALVEIRPAEAAPSTLSTPIPESAREPVGTGDEEQARSVPVRPRTMTGERFSEPARSRDLIDVPKIDISHLSLVPGWDWTLEDCQPPRVPTELPDTSHLEIVAPAPEDGEERGG